MARQLNSFMLLLVILAVIMTSAVRVTTVYADDGGTDPVPEETATPPAEEGTSAEEVAPTEEPVTVPEATEPAPTDEAGEVAPLAATEAAEPVTAEPAAEESVSVPEILEQLPEETELVVVNEAGEVEPLASAEAAEIIATGDPMWCPAGATPGDASCTGSFADFATLIDALELDASSATPLYGGTDGIIWVEYSYNGNDDSQIIFDGTLLTTLNNYNLEIQGGWSGGNNTTVNPATPSTSDVSMTVINWQGNLTIENFNIVAAGDNASVGLLIDTTGDITLNNVSVLDTPANTTDGIGDGAILFNTGNVNITGSNFSQNAGNGLIALSTGAVNITNSNFSDNNENGLIVSTHGPITLNTVIANENTLTGASLDTCLFDNTTGQCAGSGDVTITGSSTAPYSNQFDHNGFNPDGSGNLADGLIVSSGGSITIDHVQANLNSVGGATLGNADGTGNVTIDQSDFSLNPNGTGLYVFTAGDLTLTNVNALANSMGAQLFIYGSGATNIFSSNFGTTPATGNTATGLHVVAGGPVTLNTVTASYNGANGAYILSEGDITVNNSAFNGNVQDNYPEDPGLRAISFNGNITLNLVVADGNVYGAGVGLDTYGAGTITVNGGFFNQNGTFGLLAYSEDGDITLDSVTAAYNQVKGVDLGAYWAGNIRVTNSVFVENGLYGIYAFTNEGNIELNLVTVWGSDGGVGPGADDLTDYGAILEAGGDVTVRNSTFQFNTDVGLGITSGGQVNLSNVVADSNGGNGVEVFSISTVDPICEGETPVDIAVNVDGSTFTNNGYYGLMAKPGPGGTLVFVNPSTFGGNGLGDYLLDLSEPTYKDCTPEPPVETPVEPPAPTEPIVVEVPETGGTPVKQQCDMFSSTILKLPDGTWVMIPCPYQGFSRLEQILEADLPGRLGAGLKFVEGIRVSLTNGEGNVILNDAGTITINFVVPKDSGASNYSILFWDPKRNDGKGGWVELPPYEVGTSFPLNPDDPDDTRTILSGVKHNGDLVTVTVNFSGIFILIER